MIRKLHNRERRPLPFILDPQHLDHSLCRHPGRRHPVQLLEIELHG